MQQFLDFISLRNNTLEMDLKIFIQTCTKENLQLVVIVFMLIFF